MSKRLIPARPQAEQLLHWYDRHARTLPWRVSSRDRAAGKSADPYRVWLSEIMLQQTTVQAVKAYFERFTDLWPRLEDLAAASSEDVMKAWAGLGYYSRARNLKACAEALVRDHGGRFPDSEAGLLTLPGIGPYTAAAISAIAFDRRAVVVDGNVERVISRLARLETPLPAAKPEIRALTDQLTPDHRPGDFAQAMMDLGATICTPKKPACALCPFRDTCAAAQAGDAERFPVKLAKKVRPTRHGIAYVVEDVTGAVLLQRRPDRGLLGGMTGLPGSDWTETPPREAPPAQADWHTAGVIEHVFTHFRLLLEVKTARISARSNGPEGSFWSRPEDLAGEALPTVFAKAIEAVKPGATRRGKGQHRQEHGDV